MNFILAQATTENGAAGFFLGFGVIGLIVAAVVGLFWLWALIDALTNASLDPTMKIVWVLLIFFLPFLGSLAYLLLGRSGRTTA